MAGQARKEYTPEFKREAVALVIVQGVTLVGAARNLGIHRDLLRRWKRELGQDGGVAFPGNGHQTPEQVEFHRMQEENRRLRMERDILKKATAFFASESR